MITVLIKVMTMKHIDIWVTLN